MPQLSRHQLGASLLAALRQEGLGVRDLFEGRQEPLSWFFRVEAYDQSELDILESGAVDTLHAPSALVELVIDELALGIANVGMEGLAGYLALAVPWSDEEGRDALGGEPDFSEDVPPGTGGPEAEESSSLEPGEQLDPQWILPDPDVMLGFLNLDVAPPALWLEELGTEPGVSERLSQRLTRMARAVGEGADAVEVHIEGALDAGGGWTDAEGAVRPAGVSVHFSFDIPLAGAEERDLTRTFSQGARMAAQGLERMRELFAEG